MPQAGPEDLKQPPKKKKKKNNPRTNTAGGYKTRIKRLENCKLVQSFWRTVWPLGTKVI